MLNKQKKCFRKWCVKETDEEGEEEMRSSFIHFITYSYYWFCKVNNSIVSKIRGHSYQRLDAPYKQFHKSGVGGEDARKM